MNIVYLGPKQAFVIRKTLDEPVTVFLGPVVEDVRLVGGLVP